VGAISKRTTLALDAVLAAIVVLDGLPDSEERARLQTLARECEDAIRGWCEAAPAPDERESMMRRVLALNVAVTKLKRS
jgi:hypothetical protein